MCVCMKSTSALNFYYYKSQFRNALENKFNGIKESLTQKDGGDKENFFLYTLKF